MGFSGLAGGGVRRDGSRGLCVHRLDFGEMAIAMKLRFTTEAQSSQRSFLSTIPTPRSQRLGGGNFLLIVLVVLIVALIAYLVMGAPPECVLDKCNLGA